MRATNVCVRVDLCWGYCASSCNVCANECLGVLMYLLKESLLHLPNIWITASLRPFDAAVVAAPMRNECPCGFNGVALEESLALEPPTGTGKVYTRKVGHGSKDSQPEDARTL